MVKHGHTDLKQENSETLHATTVAVDGLGVLVVGPSGSGKSTLALQLIALGAVLVADDRTRVLWQGDQLLASPPVTIEGQIEARGIGLIQLPFVAPVPLRMVVDLTKLGNVRLPNPQFFQILGTQLPCFHRVEGPHLASTIFLLAKGAYLNPNDPV